MSKIISVENISKAFYCTGKKQNLFHISKKIKVLNDLSFSVNEGEIFGLLGLNGAGKTTAMRIISTLIKSDSGNVIIAGDNVKEFPYKVRRNIGFLSGDLKLDEYFTPSYLFDFFSTLREVPEIQARKRKKMLFNQFDINEYAYKRLALLSSGMKQKVSLVVSIAHDPKIIIFDEPTNGLDILSTRVVSDFLVELKNKGKTIILATHIFGFAEKICDRVGFIINGHLFNSNTLAGILKTNNLENTFFSLYKQNFQEYTS